MRLFSDITRDRLRNFKRIRRAYYSFWILAVAFLLSLFSEVFAGSRPLLLGYQGSLYFPVLFFYPGKTFGGPYQTEADYKSLQKSADFRARGGWMILPPVPYDPLRSQLELSGSPPHAPSFAHLMGTDAGARDILARIIHGFRISMLFALFVAAVTGILGVIIGGVQGYLGGRTDIIMQRFIEIWSALPFLYVVILMGSLLGRSFAVLLIVMSFFTWVGLSYYMRGEFYKTRNMTYINAARALGIGPVRIFFRHILPNSLTPLITILPFTLIGAIGTLTALDFLGFGLPPPTPSWGELMKQGMDNLHAPWISVFATLSLFITLLLATFVGEGLREAFDPRAEYRIE